jgi:hypothetical protein
MPNKPLNNDLPKPAKTIEELQAEAWMAPMTEAEKARLAAVPRRPYNPNAPGLVAGREARAKVLAKVKAMTEAQDKAQK